MPRPPATRATALRRGRRGEDNTAAVRRTELSGGLRVVTEHIPSVHSASVGVWVGVGSRDEGRTVAGAAHFLEHLLFKGTERRPAPEQISGAVEGVGGVMNAGTEQELTVYYCKVARQYMGDVLDLLFDMVCNSLVDPKEVKRERLVVVAELKKQIEPAALESIKQQVTSAISMTHSVRLSDFVLVGPGSLPLTTSGKVRRASCVELYRTDGFNRLDVTA